MPKKIKDNKEALGTILALMAALISGVSIIANKIFIVDMEPTVFTAVRALIIGIAFFMIISYQGKGVTALKKTNWKYLFAIGIIGGAFAFLLFFSGLKLTTGGNAAFLHKTLPLYTVVLAFIFLKEKITKSQKSAIFVMFFGTIAIYSADIASSGLWMNPSLGNLMIMGAAFLWAVENIIAKKAMIKGESNFTVAFARMFIGAIVLFAVLALSGDIGSFFALESQQLINLCISTALLFCYVFCWYYSIKLINVSKAATILLLAPVVSLLLGMIVLNEPAVILQLIGSVLILIGAYLAVKIKSEFATGV